MRLNRIELGEGKKNYKCKSSWDVKKYAPYYMLSPHPAIIKLLNNFKVLTVCNACAMREEFGSKYKHNRRYKNWIK